MCLHFSSLTINKPLPKLSKLKVFLLKVPDVYVQCLCCSHKNYRFIKLTMPLCCTQTYRARHEVLLVRVPFQVYTKYSEFPFDMPAAPMCRYITHTTYETYQPPRCAISTQPPPPYLTRRARTNLAALRWLSLVRTPAFCLRACLNSLGICLSRVI